MRRSTYGLVLLSTMLSIAAVIGSPWPEVSAQEDEEE
jgi:hypothetical protein